MRMTTEISGTGQTTARVESIAAHVRSRLGIDGVDAAVVLGSGWGPLLDSWPEPIARAPYDEVGLRPPVAPGHRGEIGVFEHDSQRIVVFSGRTHLFEGHGPVAVGENVLVASALGARTLVLTNANGALVPDWPLGQIMVITDHLNLTGTSPLTGGANFVDLTDLYDPALRQAMHAAAHAHGIALVEGVYAMLPGPHYETAAEARAVALLGAHALGMSTVLDAIAARAAGLRILGLSTVTAHEASGEILDPDEVVAIAEQSAARIGPAVLDVLRSAAVREA